MKEEEFNTIELAKYFNRLQKRHFYLIYVIADEKYGLPFKTFGVENALEKQNFHIR